MPTCPNHPTLALRPEKKGWYCEECGMNVLTFEQCPRPRPAPTHSPIGELDLDALPSIIALPLHDYATETRTVLKLWAMCDTVELSLRFIVFAGMAEIIRDAGNLPDTLRNDLASRIERPTLGVWRAMAQSVCRALPHKTALPELPALLMSLDSVLDAPAGLVPNAETSLAILRNRLAHGGGTTEAAARKSLVELEPRFVRAMTGAAWLRHVDLISLREDEPPGLLRGPTPRPVPYHRAIEGVTRELNAVVLVRDTVSLVLWPLLLFGRPARLDLDAPSAFAEALQVYVRREEVSLTFTPLGSDDVLQSVAGQRALDQFLRMFTPGKSDQRQFEVKGFESVLRRDAALLVGRQSEVLEAHEALTRTQRGVLWIHGTAGIGKSYLMARIAVDLLDSATQETLTLPFWFRAGDVRCSRAAFLQFAGERLRSWLGARQERDEDAGANGKILATRDDLSRLLEKVGDGKRVVFLLDGLDEIGLSDPSFARDIPLSIAMNHATWLCAGRPEGGLTEQFKVAGATVLFPDGLGPMPSDDIREMLIEGLDRGRKRLLQLDKEMSGDVRNAFVDKVVERSEGVPLYVRYTLSDLKSGKAIAERDPTWLPFSLAGYYERILSRLSIGALHKVLTPLACLLAVSKEPLEIPVLQALLVPDHVVEEGESGADLIGNALVAMQAMVKRAPSRDDGIGFTLYHQSLRDYMAESPATRSAVKLARSSLAHVAETWDQLEKGAAAKYTFRYGLRHLLDVGKSAEAKNLLTRFEYLMARSKALPAAEVTDLVRDYDLVMGHLPDGGGRAFKLWASFFRERAHILRRGDATWPFHKILLQLAVEHADDSPITRDAERWLDAGQCDWCWLRNPKRIAHAAVDPCVAVLESHYSGQGAAELEDGRILCWSALGPLQLWSSDGSSVVTLEGHAGVVLGAQQLSDGRILSWSADRSLRLWDRNGNALFMLEGHGGGVTGARQLSDGHILSWSNDNTLRLWNENGSLVSVLEGHTEPVQWATELSNGRILSWSRGMTLRLWSKDGNRVSSLEGHTGRISGALELSNGRILSWSRDNTLRLWSEEGPPVTVLGMHTAEVVGAAELSDGRILSWSRDRTLRLWREDGSPVSVLRGHEARVDGARELSDGRLLSWSCDLSLRIWDERNQRVSKLTGHGMGIFPRIFGAVELSSGRILSWSEDRTLRLWESNGTPVCALEGHTGFVKGALELLDGRIVSWANDFSARIWDPAGGAISRLERHAGDAKGARKLSDGRILSWSEDATLRLWDEDGNPISKLRGHMTPVGGATELSDGRILSWSFDSTLRIWEAGQTIAVLENPAGPVAGAMELSDARILSWTFDGTLQLWDADGAWIALLEGHSDWVQGARQLSDGRVLSWSKDNTLRLWDEHGRSIAPLVGHPFPPRETLELSDGRLLSWSNDNTLRLWSHDGNLVALLEGDPPWNPVESATELSEGRILSWFLGGTYRLWGEDGALIATRSRTDVPQEWRNGRAQALGETGPFPYHFPWTQPSSPPIAFSHAFVVGVSSVAWHADSPATVRVMLPDGSLVITLTTGDVFCLKLYRGNERISLADLEKLLG